MKLTKEQEALLAGLGMHKNNKGWYVYNLFKNDVFIYRWSRDADCHAFDSYSDNEATKYFETFDNLYSYAKETILQWEKENWAQIKAHWESNGWVFCGQTEVRKNGNYSYKVLLKDNKAEWFSFWENGIYMRFYGKEHVHSLHERLRRAEARWQADQQLDL